jgi:hypothetical protein
MAHLVADRAGELPVALDQRRQPPGPGLQRLDHPRLLVDIGPSMIFIAALPFVRLALRPRNGL